MVTDAPAVPYYAGPLVRYAVIELSKPRRSSVGFA